MYDYHYGGPLDESDANPRIKELEKMARTVLENGCLLTVAELAQVIANYASDICPFCEKGEGVLLDHQDSCPFAIALQVLTPENEGID